MLSDNKVSGTKLFGGQSEAGNTLLALICEAVLRSNCDILVVMGFQRGTQSTISDKEEH